jgi:preprotein translocase subunit YajC
MSSGLMGKVMDLSDLYVVVNVSDKVDLKFQRTHVTATLPKGTIKTLGA